MEMLLYLYAESPVHAGAADSLGILDLPVQREASTGYPVIWGQSLKGALRQAAQQHKEWSPPNVTAVFGSQVRGAGERDTDGESATTPGNLRVGDAQLVAMPVPTLRRTFAWATSEIALSRLARKYRALGCAPEAIPQVPLAVRSGRGVSVRSADPDDSWHSKRGEVVGPCVVHFDEETDGRLAHWAKRLAFDAIGADAVLAPFHAKLCKDLLLVDSEVMPVLLRECTEQSVRVQLDENKTVENGPFHSEYLPSETVLVASLSLREHARQDSADYEAELLHELLDNNLLQVGGDETLGKGLVWTRLIKKVTPLPGSGKSDEAQGPRR